MLTFMIENRKVQVWSAAAPDSPVIYLNTFEDEGKLVHQALKGSPCPDFSLVAISNLDWNHDMTPWSIPPVFKNQEACSGGADDYLRLLTEQILPKAEEELGAPRWRGIAGYSLAGLFALYSLCGTDLFSRSASVSGSLWFPGLKDYLFSHEIRCSVPHLYFSLGAKEKKTANPYLRNVQQNTEEIESFYRSRGMDTLFLTVPGNHYQNTVERTAAGISWILNR